MGPDAYSTHSSMMTSLMLAQALFRSDEMSTECTRPVKTACDSCIAEGMTVPVGLEATVKEIIIPAPAG